MRLNFPRWFFVQLGALLLLLALQTGNLGHAFGLNVAAVQSLRVAPAAGPAAPRFATGAGGCVAYPAFMLQVLSVSSSDPQAALQMLDKNEACLDAGRRTLLVPLRSSLLDRLGRYSESCQALSSINAKSALLEQSEAAYKGGKWDVLAIYLGCIEKLRDAPGYVSPGLLSEQYYRLGLYYEQAGRQSEALQAYTRSIAWNPNIYAGPVVAKARILSQLKHGQDALDLVLQNLHRPATRADAPAVYELLVELGELWEATGQAGQARCAYQQALDLTGGLPQAMDPPVLRANLMRRLDRLPKEVALDAPACKALVATWTATK